MVERLGGGSRYEVFLVWDERLLALAVAKALRPDQVTAPRARRELAREAELLGRLAHPALVRGLGAVLEGPRPHVLLEHVEGPTLERLVRRSGPLAREQLLPLALQLASALHFLAAEGVVHLDVKPANVVMSAPPRLLDLSVARTVEDAAALRHAIGTDPYMAPEQCAPGAACPVGPAADVWALGATLFHATTGAAPFPRQPGWREHGAPRLRFPQLAAAGPPPLPVAAPPALAALLAAMLARDPRARPSPREASEVLARLVEAEPERRVAITRRGRAVIR